MENAALLYTALKYKNFTLIVNCFFLVVGMGPYTLKLLPRRPDTKQPGSRMKADKEHVARSIKIARRQLDGVLKMIEDDRYCVDISNQLLATQASLKKVNQEILHAHIRGCVREGLQTDEPTPKLEEALALLEKLIS